jgi:hypothetical protein
MNQTQIRPAPFSASNTMTPDQVKMAMAVLELTVRELATITNLSPGTIMRLRFGAIVSSESRTIVKNYLSDQGVDFIDPTNEHEATIAIRR